MSLWFLEGFIGQGGAVRKIPLRVFPQVIGRDEGVDCPITSPCVSRMHARIEQLGEQLFITDLNSSNGTYINHQRIDRVTGINHGDVIHFGDLEFRLIDETHATRPGEAQSATGSQTVFLNAAQLSNAFPSGVRELEQLIEDQQVKPFFQAILGRDGATLNGYEVLGRGASDTAPVSPLELFSIAESVGKEIELSDLFRRVGVAAAAKHGLKGDIWINTHPSEIKNPDQLMASLKALRQDYPTVPLVFEVHEQCVADVQLLISLKQALSAMGVRFAFDDFGVGQSRLSEIAQVKPDVIKFDKVLIENIDKSEEGRVNVLRYLKEMVTGLKIQTLAECVENQNEYEVLKFMGFDLFQGYHFAKPMPAEQLK